MKKIELNQNQATVLDNPFVQGGQSVVVIDIADMARIDQRSEPGEHDHNRVLSEYLSEEASQELTRTMLLRAYESVVEAVEAVESPPEEKKPLNDYLDESFEYLQSHTAEEIHNDFQNKTSPLIEDPQGFEGAFQELVLPTVNKYSESVFEPFYKALDRADLGYLDEVDGARAGLNMGFISLSAEVLTVANSHSFHRDVESGAVHFSEREDVYSHNRIIYHEAAHAVLGVMEAGADLASAVKMLQEDPDSRDFLEYFRDTRLVDAMIYSDNDRAVLYNNTALAIDHALSMSPEEIANFDFLNQPAAFEEYLASDDATNKINNDAVEAIAQAIQADIHGHKYSTMLRVGTVEMTKTLVETLSGSGEITNPQSLAILKELGEALDRIENKDAGAYQRDHSQSYESGTQYDALVTPPIAPQ